jgi:hypothetical protein
VAEEFPELNPGARTLSHNQVLKVLGHPLEDEVPVAFRIAVDCDYLNDVGMLEVLEHPDFALEAFPGAFVVRSESNSLDGNHPAGLRVECLRESRLRALADCGAQGVAVAKQLGRAWLSVGMRLPKNSGALAAYRRSGADAINLPSLDGLHARNQSSALLPRI